MKFGGIIRGWYKKNRRDLPWRRTRDPYLIWLSEVILQQTRVNQGIGYYNSFRNTFPNVKSLALASEDEVLKLWQGLGYYSRARNLHQAARDVLEQYGGKIPVDYERLMELKGVGDYTASAISSICSGEARAVVDGNVSRVIARLYGVEEAINSGAGKKTVATLAGELMNEAVVEGNDPGYHNQSMMEFGALQCVPFSPGCMDCPLSGHCTAHLSGRVEVLPLKVARRRPSEHWMYYYIITCDGEIILQKRDNRDIWRSLYQFPVVETTEPLPEEIPTWEMLPEVFASSSESSITIKKVSGSIRHQLTHRTIHARFIHVELNPLPASLPARHIRIPVERTGDYPVPRLIHRYMESVKNSYL